MTREEKQKAIDALKISVPIMAVTHDEFKDYIQTLNKVMDWLEQDPILDKIRAEIDKARFVDKDTKIVKNANASGLEVAMQIIDKYKAESEDK